MDFHKTCGGMCCVWGKKLIFFGLNNLSSNTDASLINNKASDLMSSSCVWYVQMFVCQVTLTPAVSQQELGKRRLFIDVINVNSGGEDM